MANRQEGAGLKPVAGSWTIYRRKEDADMWMRFEAECARDGIVPSQKLTELANGFVIQRRA